MYIQAYNRLYKTFNVKKKIGNYIAGVATVFPTIM